jgi:hypothetical protein
MTWRVLPILSLVQKLVSQAYQQELIGYRDVSDNLMNKVLLHTMLSGL